MSNANSYIGVDLHKKMCFVTVMDKEGKIKKQTEISTDADKVAKFFSQHLIGLYFTGQAANFSPFFKRHPTGKK